MRQVALTIPGIPKPKGSLRCIGRRGRTGHQLIEDHRPGQKTWRDRIAYAARQTSLTARPREPITVAINFTLPRPRGHYGTGHNADTLRPGRLAESATSLRTGDIDKLCRLVLDALQDGGLLDDDAQVIELVAGKKYVDGLGDRLGYAGAQITVCFPTRTESERPI